MKEYSVAVIPGDGIGPEITAVATRILLRACELQGVAAPHLEAHDAGAGRWLRTGVAMPSETFEACAQADAILLGAVGHPEARHPDGREVGNDVVLRLRFDLDLYAGIRPIRSYVGVQPILTSAKAIDYVLVRENVEGIYASRTGGTNVRNEVVTDSIVITSTGTQRVCEAAFRLATERASRANGSRPAVTCVDKANVLSSFAFFRATFDDVARHHADVAANHLYADAMAARQVLSPETFDVVVTENLFGDILSDLAAATVGGLGLAPSADLGDNHAVFQPAHGSAPDIAGHGTANPLAAVLSAAMMMTWLGQRNSDSDASTVGAKIDAAVTHFLASNTHLRTPDLGGTSSTSDIADALLTALESLYT